MTKLQVPEGMREAALMSLYDPAHTPNIESYWTFLEAALQWLRENPIVPTDEQCASMDSEYDSNEEYEDMTPTRAISVLWGRRMFLAEPEVPEEVKDLLWNNPPDNDGRRGSTAVEHAEKRIIEAFHRGQRSKGSV